MILILTTERYEQTTDPVVQYLTYCGASFLRLSVRDLLFGSSEVEVDIIANDIMVNGAGVCDEINVVWFRRMLPRDASTLFGENDRSFLFAPDVREEAMDILGHIFNILRDKIWLPKYTSIGLNKLSMLEKAVCHGISVPRSKLINRKDKLEAFYHECGGKLITKPCHRNVFYLDGGDAYLAMTKTIGEEELRDIPETFFISLFQEFIQADLELRVFYLDGQFFTLSSLPMVDPEHMPEDIKLAVMEGKVEYARYLLPLNLCERLEMLLRELELNICTLDLLEKDGEHFLLDINPLGQFIFESRTGNEFSEKVVADWLRSKDYTGKKKYGKTRKPRKAVH